MRLLRSVRFRLTATTVLILAVAVVVVGVVLLDRVRDTLFEEVDAAVGARADDLAARIEAEGTIGDVGLGTDFGTLAVVFGPTDEVFATTDDSVDPIDLLDSVAVGNELRLYEPRTVELPQLEETAGSDRMRAVLAEAVVFDEEAAVLGEDPLVLGEDGVLLDGPVPGEEDFIFVYAATSLDGVDDTVDQLRNGLLVGGPAIVLVGGIMAWLAAGRALRPVERMRREVDSISADDLHRRLATAAGDDEIARLAATMNDLLDRVDTSQRRLSQFVSDAAHELRTPLTALTAQLDVDAAHPEAVDEAATDRVIREHTERLRSIVDDLLLLARVDDDRLALARQPIDFGDLVLEAAHASPRPTGVELDPTSVRTGVSCLGDPLRLRRVVTNLVINAANHAVHTVALVVEGGPEGLVLHVDDDGPGVPVADRERIFERFIRLDEARSRDRGGTGLGLAIAAELVAAHGGSITVGDGPLGGARFTVELPRT